MLNATIRLGLAGFGTVGTGLARILQENQAWIQRRLGAKVSISSVLVRNLDKKRPFLPEPGTRFTSDLNDLIQDPKIDIIVELMGGLDTAYEVIYQSLNAGKHVVTANKALLAHKGPELFTLAAEKNLGLYYEASVAGGVPLVQTLKESLAGNKIKNLTGILNGTANFILSEMSSEEISFAHALQKAQENGYAEADPELDVGGMDAAHKLCVLIRLAYGQDYPLELLPVQGISNLDYYDIEMASFFGYRIKLLAQIKAKSGHLQAGVFPVLISRDHILAKVEGPFNAVLIEGNAVGPIMLYGQGAGDLPTGSAVLSDIMSLARNSSNPNNTGFLEPDLPRAQILEPDLTVFRHYFRFTVQDKPGVLSALSGIMGERNISIAQVVQKQQQNGKAVPVVFLTHAAQMKNINEDMTESGLLSAPTVHYRIL